MGNCHIIKKGEFSQFFIDSTEILLELAILMTRMIHMINKTEVFLLRIVKSPNSPEWNFFRKEQPFSNRHKLK